MKNLIVVERSSGHGSWALYNDNTQVATYPFEAGLPRAPTWYTDVISGIAKAGLTPQDIGGMLVGTGPGSFSGIRAVLAAMQGLSIPGNLPVLGLSSAAALARATALANKASTVAVVGNARRNTLWCAIYNVSPDGNITMHSTGTAPTHTASDFSLPHPEEITNIIPAGALVVSPEYTSLQKILAEIPDVKLVEEDLFPSAADLAELYNSNPEASIRDPLPVYLHPAVVPASK